MTQKEEEQFNNNLINNNYYNNKVNDVSDEKITNKGKNKETNI
jgi:hypothetical protein